MSFDPTTLAIILGLISAISLAAVNAVIKAGKDILMARVVLSGSSAILVFPAIFFVPLPTADIGIALIFSLLAHGLYQFGLINALSRGDLSVVFPVMRGSAPILVGIMAVIFLNEALSAREWAGLILATVGTLGFVLKPGKLASGLDVPKSALAFAALTAIGIALYSIADARGIRLSGDPLTYIVWLFVLDGVQISLAAAFIRGSTVFTDARKIWPYGLIAGVGSILSFGIALYAMNLTEVARVSALRESAVVFGALFGWLFLKEGFGLRRVSFASVIAAGLLLMNL